jgi:hypothetical protein
MSPTTEISVEAPFAAPVFERVRSIQAARVETEWSAITEVSDGAWNQALRDVLELAALEDDWDSYGSPPPAAFTMALALRMIRTASELRSVLSAPHVSPAPGGEIDLLWTSGDSRVEVLVGPESVEYLKVPENEQPEEGGLRSFAQLRDLLVWLASV